jgi:hypothetical protein
VSCLNGATPSPDKLKCCIAPSANQVDNNCNPTECITNYIKSDNGTRCCYNNITNAKSYNNNGNICSVSSCNTGYFL